MNRYEFESLISDYLDGSMPFKKRKIFEDHLKTDPDAESLINNIRMTIADMSNLNKVKASEDFNEKLLKRVKKEGMVIQPNNNTIFGFTTFYATVLSSLAIALFVVASQLLNVSENSELHNQNKYQATNSAINTPSYSKKMTIDNNHLVESSNDSLIDKEKKEKSNNSNKIKFINY
jgi:anti-sigma-K factor RskA|tara:strand:- start:816 stop:1343 length:528 start_codon:yes stop_codon:yes gene_type:complete